MTRCHVPCWKTHQFICPSPPPPSYPFDLPRWLVGGVNFWGTPLTLASCTGGIKFIFWTHVGHGYFLFFVLFLDLSDTAENVNFLLHSWKKVELLMPTSRIDDVSTALISNRSSNYVMQIGYKLLFFSI